MNVAIRMPPSLTLLMGALLFGLVTLGLVLAPTVILPPPSSAVAPYADSPVHLVLRSTDPLSYYQPVWLHPLFNKARSKDLPPPPPPPPPAPKPPDLTAYRLVGIITSPSLRMVLVRRATGGDLLRLKAGDTLDGWTITDIGVNGASVSADGIVQVLPMAKPSSVIKQPLQTAGGALQSNE